MNVSYQEADSLISGANLQIAKPEGNANQFYSHRDATSRSWIDHIAFNGRMDKLEKIDPCDIT